VEESTLHIEDRRQALFARDSLADTWLFTASGQHPDSAAETAREAFETALEVFRTLRRREGAVTAVEAEQISVEMRRKHRDNAEVVTILLRWTLEPSREDLLDILESNPALLEAAGRDTELIHLLDTVVQDNSHIGTVRSLAGDPSALKLKLKELS